MGEAFPGAGRDPRKVRHEDTRSRLYRVVHVLNAFPVLLGFARNALDPTHGLDKFVGRTLSEDEFWLVMERRIDRELQGMEDPHLRRMWCDGIRGFFVRPDGAAPHVFGTIWLGNDGQTEMQLKMAVPDHALDGDRIDWSALIPPADLTGWLAVEPHRRRVAIDISKGEPV